MKFIILFAICIPTISRGQLIFDRGHFGAVSQNGASREAAEAAHISYLNNIEERLKDINLDLSSVALVQSMIERSLAEVDHALKTGQTVKQITLVSAEIIAECNQILQAAQQAPQLLLFAQEASTEFKDRGLRLAAEVAVFIVKEGGNIMMDFEKRDALLQKVSLELRVMRALAYSIHRSMYWAGQNGFWKTANPFREFINRDSKLVSDILQRSYLLK
jgi:DNA-directed RNA polymerase beta' subunit